MVPAKNNNAFYILAFAWLVTQGVLWYFNGTVITNEALKYIGQAYHLQHEHHLDASKYIFYLIPVCLIYGSLILHAGFAWVVIVQLLVNAAATAVFYKIAKKIFSNKKQALFATLILITFLPLQYWNSFLYTESIFYSLCIFFMYGCIVLPATKKSTHVIRFVIIAALVFTRPMGILFLPVIAFYYLSQSKLRLAVKWLVAISACVAVYLLVNFLYHGGADMDILMPQREGFIVCYGDSIKQPGLQIINSGNPLNDLGYFIVNNPLYFLKLAFNRLLSFFTLSRSYYSPLHNLYLIGCMMFLYVFAFVSIAASAFAKKVCFKNIFFPLLAIFCTGVMLQCDDFNSRFCMPLFPWIILLATDGMYAVIARFTKAK